jgi:hypothetical protein
MLEKESEQKSSKTNNKNYNLPFKNNLISTNISDYNRLEIISQENPIYNDKNTN